MSEKLAAPTISLAPGEELDEEKFRDFMRRLEEHLQTPVSTREEAMALVEENMAAARAALAVYEAARGKQGPIDPTGANAEAMEEDSFNENEPTGNEVEKNPEA